MSQGKLTVPSIDDKEDMQFADEAFDILGFSLSYELGATSILEMLNLAWVPLLAAERGDLRFSIRGRTAGRSPAPGRRRRLPDAGRRRCCRPVRQRPRSVYR